MGKKLFWGLNIFLLMSTACAQVSPVQTPVEGSPMINLTSPAFPEGGTIPRKFTCDGENVSPELLWTSLPSETQSISIIVDDPDAPAGTWVHWVLFDIPPQISSLTEGYRGAGVNGVNDFRKLGYNGPCPPKGSGHRYFFKLYALDSMLQLKQGVTKKDIENAMKDHILAQGQLVGRYGR
jgi:Raf kinase inhibitor-like YbhB/YbcL family protein